MSFSHATGKDSAQQKKGLVCKEHVQGKAMHQARLQCEGPESRGLGSKRKAFVQSSRCAMNSSSTNMSGEL